LIISKLTQTSGNCGAPKNSCFWTVLLMWIYFRNNIHYIFNDLSLDSYRNHPVLYIWILGSIFCGAFYSDWTFIGCNFIVYVYTAAQRLRECNCISTSWHAEGLYFFTYAVTAVENNLWIILNFNFSLFQRCSNQVFIKWSDKIVLGFLQASLTMYDRDRYNVEDIRDCISWGVIYILQSAEELWIDVAERSKLDSVANHGFIDHCGPIIDRKRT